MRTKLRLTLAVGLALAATAPALAEDRGALSGHDDVDYGKEPAAPAWTATVPAPKQDDSKMQPPAPAPGMERKSGVATDGGYDATRMLPTDR
ncbi:hypothetical protein [Anaeromyxobacter terrae]|uniref:hypothetical protein n=1 Tax=Anaeromyxobacter terrae TaxID=2925406 RepID=UPI001F59BB80|nr:hypothetical protein [Anaeromyxobacter sp. SG22]